MRIKGIIRKIIPQIKLLIVLASLFNFGVSAAEFKISVRAYHGINDAYQQWEATVDTFNEQMPEHSFFSTGC